MQTVKNKAGREKTDILIKVWQTGMQGGTPDPGGAKNTADSSLVQDRENVNEHKKQGDSWKNNDSMI